MEFGTSEGPDIGKDAIMCTKFAYITQVPCKLRTALLMILMLEGMSVALI